jgi:hypothetical protein
MGASQSALSIQNPSQSGPRTHGNDDHFRTHGADVPISTTAADEESSAIRAITECSVGGALRFIYQAIPLSLDLHVDATTSGIDIKACLCGGKADYHPGLICHQGASFPFGNSHTAGALGTDIIMTVEILKML